MPPPAVPRHPLEVIMRRPDVSRPLILRSLRGLLPLTVLLVAACGLSFDFGGPAVRGTGTVVTSTRPVPAFDHVAVGGDFDVTITAGPARGLTMTGDDNLLPLIETDVRNGTLHIDTDKNLRSDEPLRIVITTPTLAGVSSGGSSTIRVSGVRADHFEASVSGSSQMTAAGAVRELTASVSGSGDIAMTGAAQHVEGSVSGSGGLDLHGVRAQTASVRVSGSGNVSLHVTERLEARVSGSGNVSYSGNPAVESETSGSGSVERV